MTFGKLKRWYFEECDSVQNSKIVDCLVMTFEQLKSSYFEERDGVHNSKLWIVEI